MILKSIRGNYMTYTIPSLDDTSYGEYPPFFCVVDVHIIQMKSLASSIIPDALKEWDNLPNCNLSVFKVRKSK